VTVGHDFDITILLKASCTVSPWVWSHGNCDKTHKCDVFVSH